MMRWNTLIPGFAALLLLAGCQREEAGCPARPGEAVVSAVLTVESETPYTRAESDDPSEAQIHNLCILQYRGTTDDATIVREVSYLTDEADPSDDEHRLDLTALRLAASMGETHTVVFLTNTYATLPQVETLGELKALFRTIPSETDAFRPEAPRLNGIAVSRIDNGTVLHVILRRAVARVRVHLSNDGADGLAIRQVRLCNVPRKEYYLTDYSYLDPADARTVQALFEDPFQDEYRADNPLRTDYAAVAWNGLSDGTGSGTYTWYVPANMRGTDPSVTLAGEKGKSQLAAGATFLEVGADYGPSHDKHIRYRFWLGADLLQDFNLRPNGAYTYDITLSGKGDPSVDSRIEDLSITDFDVDANCYMLQPPESGIRRYTFNAVHRPNEFWGPRYGIDRLEPGLTIDENKTWRARLIWSDFPMTRAEASAFLSRRQGIGAGTYLSDSQRIEISVPAGMAPGSVLVGIYTDNPDELLWSWHLWITDYDPDAIGNRAPVEGTYLYPVPGGEVHRYAGVSWKPGGRYEKGYVMDRNLGAIDTDYHSHRQRGNGFRYQYGRKDPLSYWDYPLWTYDMDDNVTEVPRGTLDLSDDNGTTTMNYSVHHPTQIFRYGRNYGIYENGPAWMEQAPFVSLDRLQLWNDPFYNRHTDNEEAGTNADKSFFDPCPPGWKLPVGSTGTNVGESKTDYWMEGFRGDGNGTSTTSPETNVIFYMPMGPYSTHLDEEPHQGATYYPRGYLADKDNPDAPTIFFPYAVSYYTGRSPFWTSEPSSNVTYSAEATTFSFSYSAGGGGSVGHSDSYSRNYMHAIRCLRQ